MKKINFFLVFTILSFSISCSSDSNNNNENNINNYPFSFNVEGYHTYKQEYVELAKWDVTPLSNGTFNYSIDVLSVSRQGVNNQDDEISPVYISFNLPSQIVEGQIIDIANISEISGLFPTNDAPLTTYSIYGCSYANQAYYMRPEITTNTTGQIKITDINGDKISGTFFFNNLSNYFYNDYYFGSGNYYQNGNCGVISAPQAPLTFSISNGVFTNLIKE